MDLYFLFFFLALVPSVRGQVIDPDPEGPNPVPAVDGVFIEEMTWMEIEEKLKNSYPFRSVKERYVPTYTFNNRDSSKLKF